MVYLGSATADFETDLAPMISRVADWELDKQELGRTLTYNVRANWKLLFQNYSECYHCPTVHPNLNRLTPYKTAKNDLTDGPILGGPMELADGFETVSVDGKHVGQVFRELSDRQRRSVYYYTIFPNMFISAHPDYVMVHQIERVSNVQSTVTCYFLAAPGTAADDLARAVDQWDEINRQDWHVCELTQKGIESPAYVPGPYSNLETMLMAFDRHYRAAMANA
jgi:Rieske 2Fe-2S family protein